MTTAEKAEVMIAHTLGQEIQVRVSEAEQWIDTGNPLWDWKNLDYRVKPKEKRTIYVATDSKGELYAGIYTLNKEAMIRLGFDHFAKFTEE